MKAYEECARYLGCLCFYTANPPNTTICLDAFSLSCDELVRCKSSNYECEELEYQCIYHPRCHSYPVCYPIPSYSPQFCASLFSKDEKMLCIASTVLSS